MAIELKYDKTEHCWHMKMVALSGKSLLWVT